MNPIPPSLFFLKGETLSEALCEALCEAIEPWIRQHGGLLNNRIYVFFVEEATLPREVKTAIKGCAAWRVSIAGITSVAQTEELIDRILDCWNRQKFDNLPPHLRTLALHNLYCQRPPATWGTFDEERLPPMPDGYLLTDEHGQPLFDDYREAQWRVECMIRLRRGGVAA